VTTCRSHIPCQGMGRCIRRRSSSFTSLSLATARSRRVFRLSRKFPRRDLPHRNVKPRKLKVSGFPSGLREQLAPGAAPAVCDQPGGWDLDHRQRRRDPPHRRRRDRLGRRHHRQRATSPDRRATNRAARSSCRSIDWSGGATVFLLRERSENFRAILQSFPEWGLCCCDEFSGLLPRERQMLVERLGFKTRRA
jgi:hypothetical protein